MTAQLEFDDLLKAAREGADEPLGELLARYRNVLKMLVRAQLQGQLRVKADASDIVQDALVHAVKGFPSFQGYTEASMIAWLRSILANRLVTFYRHHYAGKRSIELERRLDAELQQSSVALQNAVVNYATPSGGVEREEQLLALAAAVEALPDEYRTVIVLRHIRGERFVTIAETMGRSRDSVRKLWVRALERLKARMEDA